MKRLRPRIKRVDGVAYCCLFRGGGAATAVVPYLEACGPNPQQPSSNFLDARDQMYRQFQLLLAHARGERWKLDGDAVVAQPLG